MSHLKILITTERFPPDVFGGGEISAYLLASALASRHEVHILTSKNNEKDKNSKLKKNELFSELNKLNIHRVIKPLKEYNRVFPLDVRHNEIFYKQSFFAIDDFLNKNDGFDLIHSLNLKTVVGSTLAAKLRNIPIIATVNDHWATCYYRSHFKNNSICLTCSNQGLKECMNAQIGSAIMLPYVKYSMWLKKYFLLRCNGLIVISDKVKEILKSNGFHQPIVTIPIMIDSEIFNYEKPRYTGNVLYLGRVDYGKGVEVAIQAFAKAGVGRLIIAGTGSDLVTSKKLVKRLGVDDKVEFKGSIPYNYIPETIHESDIVLAPFQRVEAFGRVLLEANACGRGVITSDIGGGSQMFIKNGKNGLSFPPNDVVGMGKAIKNILSNKKLIESLGRTGRNMVENQIKTEKILKQTEKFYNLIIKEFAE